MTADKNNGTHIRPTEMDYMRARNLAKTSTVCDCAQCVAAMAQAFAEVAAPLRTQIARVEKERDEARAALNAPREIDVTDPFDVVLLGALGRAAGNVDGPARAALDALARELLR